MILYHTRLVTRESLKPSVKVENCRKFKIKSFLRLQNFWGVRVVFLNSTVQLHIRTPLFVEHGRVGKFSQTKIFPTSRSFSQYACSWKGQLESSFQDIWLTWKINKLERFFQYKTFKILDLSNYPFQLHVSRKMLLSW